MTGKLIKYESRSGLRYIGIIWAALIASAVLLGIMLKVMETVFPDNSQGVLKLFEVIFNIIPPLLYGVIMVAMIVITILIIVMRFYKGLLGDEGYLMHTLPVKPWQLIASKGIVACGIVIISCIAIVLSIFIILIIQDPREFFSGFGDFISVLGEEPRLILIIFEVLIIVILGAMASIYHIYASMAIGQLAGKYRLLTSLGAYIGINMVLTVLAVAVLVLGDMTGIDVWLRDWLLSMDRNVGEYIGGFAFLQAGIAAAFIIQALQLAAFHVITERILSKKLNLI